MTTEIYDTLPEEAKMIRKKVFIEEQGFQNELDQIDSASFHIVMYNDNGEPIATCRVFPGEEDTFLMGRLAVIREYRGRNIGASMIREAEKLVLAKKGRKILLHAQCRVKDFYKKQGFSEYGNVEEEEGCPHIWMEKQL